MEQMNITLNKEEISKPFVINQYSKNFSYKLNIFNSDGTPYVFKTGDYIIMEVAINNIAIILSGVDFSIVGNVATFNIPRELTLNSGKGTYNVSIVNDSDNSRIACFSKEIVVKSNSIDEDTVSTDLIVTAIENLNNATVVANSKLTELNQAIANGDLNNKVDKVAGKALSTNDFTNTYKNEVDKVANKQDKTDNSLSTANKTVVGAINEVKGYTDTVDYSESITIPSNLMFIPNTKKSFIKNSKNLVVINFSISNTTSNNGITNQVIATIPSNIRPSVLVYTSAMATRLGTEEEYSPVLLIIKPNGEISVYLKGSKYTAYYRIDCSIAYYI